MAINAQEVSAESRAVFEGIVELRSKVGMRTVPFKTGYIDLEVYKRQLAKGTEGQLSPLSTELAVHLVQWLSLIRFSAPDELEGVLNAAVPFVTAIIKEADLPDIYSKWRAASKNMESFSPEESEIAFVFDVLMHSASAVGLRSKAH